MAQREINRFAELETFVRVVELGGFSPAARAARMTPSAVSKLIARLEARLGTRLVNRSTRKLQLTPEGQGFYERAQRILADLADAESVATGGETPTGRLRINTSASFGTHVLVPLVPRFLDRFPGISLELHHTDAMVDLVAEGIDVAVRAGPLKSSSLIARKLGTTTLMLVAAPDYLARHGTPRTVADLATHLRLGFTYKRATESWPLVDDRARTMLPPGGRLLASDGEALRHLAVAGAGIARMAGFTVAADLAAGRLVRVMGESDPEDREDFYAVYVGQGGPLPARVRALLDFLAAEARLD